MARDNPLEVKILGLSGGSVTYTTRSELQPSDREVMAPAVDFASWLLSMQESGMRILLEEKENRNSIYLQAQTIDGVLVSSGAAQFLQEADSLRIDYALSQVRQGVNAATLAYAYPQHYTEGLVDYGLRAVLYFLLYSQPTNEHVSKPILTKTIGVKNAERARRNAQLLLKDEMEAPAFAPFVSQGFMTFTQIIFDESSLAKPQPHDFSTGIPPEKGGGYIHIVMSDAYRVLSGLHNVTVSKARLLE